MISRLTSNSYGFGYLQALLTSSTIAGLALFGMKLAKDHEAVVDYSYKKKLTYYITQEINDLLQNENNCRVSLQGRSAVSSYLTHLYKVKNKQKLSTFFTDQEFFNNQIKIKSLKIYGKREDARLSKGLTFLEIDFNIVNSDKIIKRSVPIYFNSAVNAKVSSCYSKVQSVFTSKDKYWKSVNGTTFSALGQVELSPKQSLKTSSAAWNNYGAISFQVKKLNDLQKCSSLIEGAIGFSDIYGPSICTGSKWRRLGTRSLSWHLRDDYQITLDRAGSKDLTISNYDTCFMRRMHKRNLSEGCLLKKLGSTYLLTAYSSENISSLLCKVSCVK